MQRTTTVLAGALAAAALSCGVLAPSAVAFSVPKARAYKNCTALNQVYKHGVAKKGARDHTSGKPVTAFFVDSKTYAMNDGRVSSLGQYDLDRDNDGIACE